LLHGVGRFGSGRAADDDVAAILTAAGELERATPATMEEFISKWRALAAYWKALEFDVEADDITMMLSEIAAVTRRTPL
jgi:hypothetical protein